MIGPISRPQLIARQAELFNSPSDVAARDMIGWTLTVNGVGGRIVETEAYHHEDPASHSFSGPTPRNEVMFGPPGVGPGSAVLLRALEPTAGLALMSARRGTNDPRLLCSGPGRLGQALAVTREQNGLRLDEPPFELIPGDAAGIVVGPRIGISKAMDAPWRFGERGSRFLSRPFPAARG